MHRGILRWAARIVGLRDVEARIAAVGNELGSMYRGTTRWDNMYRGVTRLNNINRGGNEMGQRVS